MATFYTIDRLGTLRPGLTVELSREFENCQFHTTHDGPSRAELESHLRELFPEGLTSHGKFYLLNHQLANPTWTPGVAGGPLVPVSPMIELIYELVRRSDFPSRPSRYASMFALETIEEAVKFRQRAQWQGRILEVEPTSMFRADMNQLKIGASGIAGLLHAKRYWEGTASQAPIWEYLLQGPIRVLREV
ncbi:hypothetical protein [Caballeronia sp. S22]|uniref:hypothetical protein n=1 Tax=Caballeronia sp. S22 TaxID=3137182 RepID=UPI00353106B5